MTHGTGTDALLKHAQRQRAKNGVGFICHGIGIVSGVGSDHFHALIRVLDLPHGLVVFYVEAF